MQAESFGAVCERELSDETTHVVATRITAKVRQAMAMPGVCIVRLDWLRDTMATWTRKDEQVRAYGCGKFALIQGTRALLVAVVTLWSAMFSPQERRY
jgi:hypothetical protein